METQVVVYWIAGDGSTGPLLGYGSLVAETLVLLHPPADRAALANTGSGRLRSQVIAANGSVEVVDGDLLPPDPDLPGSPTAVELDWEPTASPTTIPGVEVQQAPVLLAALVADFVAAQGRSDPSEPPLASPAHADPGTPNPLPPLWKKAWWCKICPHARACR